jgi:predicted alpha/beta hydrolase family esterase
LIPVERIVAITVRGREGLGERSNNHWQRKELKKSQWKRDQNPNWQLGESARKIGVVGNQL